MVELQLERFSALVSDVWACLMGFKVRLDHFWRKKQFGCQSVNEKEKRQTVRDSMLPSDTYHGTYMNLITARIASPRRIGWSFAASTHCSAPVLLVLLVLLVPLVHLILLVLLVLLVPLSIPVAKVRSGKHTYNIIKYYAACTGDDQLKAVTSNSLSEQRCKPT